MARTPILTTVMLSLTMILLILEILEIPGSNSGSDNSKLEG